MQRGEVGLETIVGDAEYALEENEQRVAEDVLQRQRSYVMTKFWKRKYEGEAQKNWDMFYGRNADRFFKDRHYLEAQFPQMLKLNTLLECGCGVGNAVLPLLEVLPELKVLAVDHSAKAIELLKSRPEYDDERCHAWVGDLVHEEFPSEVREIDGALLLFVLSAIPPEAHRDVLGKIVQVLRPGGYFFFRDYGRYDMAQLRFKGSCRMDEHYYVRQDGTLSYFFTLNELQSMFEAVGLEVIELNYRRREVINRKMKETMTRVWVHAICRKKELI